MPDSWQPLTLRAGPLWVRFEPAAGMLRYVRLGTTEVLRGVYAAVRDRNWETIAPVVSNLSVKQEVDAFRVSFDVACVRDEIDFCWGGSIEGNRDGTIVYRMSGEARSDFLRNRIGLCVLHPIRECAGQHCIVTHVDGRVTGGVFPQEIAPHQPFQEIRSIRHEVTDGVEAEVTFAGETFEMEDQRNWTDASFKTYGTPLALPFPVQVHRGDRVQQSVTLALVGADQSSARTAGHPFRETRPAPRVVFPGRRLPALGLCVARLDRTLSAPEMNRLAALRLSHLRVDLRFGDDPWRQALEVAAGQAAAVGAQLDLAITLSDAAEDELARLAAAVEELRPPVSHVFVFHERDKSTGSKWVELARGWLVEAIRRSSPAGTAGSTLAGGAGPLLAGGTNAYFAELNRGRPDVAAMDAVVYSINPQVHASDDASVMETLQAQGETVRSAEQFCGGKPICVGPITLRPRFNPNATSAPPSTPPEELPPEADPRQCGLFAAAWTLGSISELSLAGGARLTYFETAGRLGVMEMDDGPPLPLQKRFPSAAGGVYPVYHVFADVGEFAGGEIALLDFGRPLEVRGAMLRKTSQRKEGHYRLLVANVSDRMQQVEMPRLDWSRGRPFRRRTLDDRTVQTAVGEPERFRKETAEFAGSMLDLRPYAYVCLDITGT